MQIDVIVNIYSLNSCRNKNELFSKMFKDRRIAQSFAVGSTKCFWKNFWISTIFITYVVLRKVNSLIKKGQMDFHVRFWENTINTVSTRYYNSKFLQKAAAVDVHQKFESCLKDLDANKMIQVFL